MSRADRFDRADFETRYAEPARPLASSEEAPRAAAPPPRAVSPAETSRSPIARNARVLIWPIAPDKLRRVGESVLAHRKGSNRPHRGVDLFADPGTEVRVACGGAILRVVDGRDRQNEALRRAGLFVDIQGTDALVYRYLHLGAVRLTKGASVPQGMVLGTVAAAHTSGLAETPHLHFEIRQGDYDRTKKDYGPPVDPLRLLPPLHEA